MVATQGIAGEIDRGCIMHGTRAMGLRPCDFGRPTRVNVVRRNRDATVMLQAYCVGASGNDSLPTNRRLKMLRRIDGTVGGENSEVAAVDVLLVAKDGGSTARPAPQLSRVRAVP